MAQLTVDLNDAASIELALSILQSLMGGTNALVGNVADVGDLDMGEGDLGSGDLDMDDLLNEPEPEPQFTVETMKDSFRALAKAAGKDAAVALVKKALAKLGVDKMEEVPEEKRESLIKILNLTAAKAAKK